MPVLVESISINAETELGTAVAVGLTKGDQRQKKFGTLLYIC